MRLNRKTMIYQKKQNTKVGIDYSLTSPAVCINDGKLNFYYLTTKKKWQGQQSENIIGYEHKAWTDPIERFKNISDFVFDILTPIHTPTVIYIEGYSFGSKGQAVFQIAENCGILKYRLQLAEIEYDTVVPSVVKKFATSKGNADKQLMYDSFKEYTKVDLMKKFDMEKLNNPVTDIVDSYYIAKVGYENSINNI